MTMTKDAWNPNQYNKFQSERSQPFWDLAARVDFKDLRTLLDVGCGTGELTRSLCDKYCLERVLGMDSSAKMLQESAKFAASNLTFQRADISTFDPDEKFDVVFSNAALQWVGYHRDLFTHMVSWINPGGVLAVQMPVNFDHPSHILAGDVARDFGLEPRQPPVLPADEYAQLFWKLGLKDISVDVHVYLHPMSSAAEVPEWTKGTLLTHYQNQLSPERFTEFVRTYTERFLKTVPPGPYLYTFKRLFLVARN